MWTVGERLQITTRFSSKPILRHMHPNREAVIKGSASVANLDFPTGYLIWATAAVIGLCGLSVMADARAGTARSPTTSALKETPTHWRVVGNARASYELRAERAAVLSGKASAVLIASEDADPLLFGALMQSSSSARFRGKRVELSAYIACESAPAGASIWLRADDADGSVVAIEDAFLRGIRGTETWTYQAIVMDIPDTATSVHYGVILRGQGSLYVDDLQFRMVNPDVSLTASPLLYKLPFGARPSESVQLPAEPRNLDFEEIALATP